MTCAENFSHSREAFETLSLSVSLERAADHSEVYRIVELALQCKHNKLASDRGGLD